MRLPNILWAYILAVSTFQLGNVVRIPFADGPRVPKFEFVRDPNQNLGGYLSNGLWKSQIQMTKSTISQMSMVRAGRELGNSLRTALGQRIDWVIWGGREPLMLFPSIDLWVSRGPSSSVNADLQRAARAISDYRNVLQREGWTLVVVPVPTKIGIHRELARWPILDSNLVTLESIQFDKSDDTYARFGDNLSERNVNWIDLQTRFRQAVVQEPGDLLYATNDSHWSGKGIQIAAIATAEKISSLSKLDFHVVSTPTYYELEHHGDLVGAYELFPTLTTWLTPAWLFHERLVNGEEGVGYQYPTNPDGLVVVVGTSFTGQYTWVLQQPVGFSWQIGLHLANVEVQNRPIAGKGSFFPFHEFLSHRNEILSEFISRCGKKSPPHIVIWEFPIRDLRAIAPPSLGG